MKANINGTDKTIRIVLAITFAVLFFTGVISGTAGIVLLVAGAIFLMTAVINFCPIYHVLGISTKGSTNDRKK